MDNHFSKSQEGDIILSFLHHGEDKRKVKSREMVAASSYKEIQAGKSGLGFPSS